MTSSGIAAAVQTSSSDSRSGALPGELDLQAGMKHLTYLREVLHGSLWLSSFLHFSVIPLQHAEVVASYAKVEAAGSGKLGRLLS